jgi:hypothetical protein
MLLETSGRDGLPRAELTQVFVALKIQGQGSAGGALAPQYLPPEKNPSNSCLTPPCTEFSGHVRCPHCGANTPISQ